MFSNLQTPETKTAQSVKETKDDNDARLACEAIPGFFDECRRVAGIIAKQAIEHHAEPDTQYKEFMDFSVIRGPRFIYETICGILRDTYDRRCCIIGQGYDLRIRVIFPGASDAVESAPINAFFGERIATMSDPLCSANPAGMSNLGPSSTSSAITTD